MEPVGIYASIKISKERLDDFYRDWGDALIDDVRCILGKKSGLQQHSFGGFVDPATEYYHDPRNKLVIRYDAVTETLFYLYQLEVRDLQSMESAPSFLALKKIAGYRDRGDVDYIAFTPSAPNFMHDPLWRGYQLTADSLSEIAVDAFPRDRQREIDMLSKRYYWGPIDEMFDKADRGEDVSYFANFFPDHCLDASLLGLLGIAKPV